MLSFGTTWLQVTRVMPHHMGLHGEHNNDEHIQPNKSDLVAVMAVIAPFCLEMRKEAFCLYTPKD